MAAALGEVQPATFPCTYIFLGLYSSSDLLELSSQQFEQLVSITVFIRVVTYSNNQSTGKGIARRLVFIRVVTYSN